MEMAGINYSIVRQSVPMSQVLELLDFVAVERNGDQLRGVLSSALIVVARDPVVFGESGRERISLLHLQSGRQSARSMVAGAQVDAVRCRC